MRIVSKTKTKQTNSPALAAGGKEYMKFRIEQKNKNLKSNKDKECIVQNGECDP